MIKLNLLEINQPIGTFYIGKTTIRELSKFSSIKRREDNKEGVQRTLKENRVKDIAYYCKDPEATFPTPIILAVDTDLVLNKVKNCGIYTFSFEENELEAEILDGQHRYKGILQSGKIDIEVPIVLMFNIKNYERAYVFSTINKNQTKVDKSLIYEHYGVAKERSPYRTSHEIAKILNMDEDSAFCGRLKMLEKRENKEQTLSQGTFVTHLLGLITSKPNKDTIDIKNNIELIGNSNKVFRKYFNNNQDEVIVNILKNYFYAVRQVFQKEWNDPKNYILTKTTGYGGLMKALKTLVPAGEEKGDLSKDFFLNIFKNLKITFKEKNIVWTSEEFGSGAAAQSKVSELILEQLNK